MSTVVKSFSGAGVSDSLFLRKGEAYTYVVDYSSDFDGGLFLEYSADGQSYNIVRNFGVGYKTDVTSTLVDDAPAGLYRFRCIIDPNTVSLTGSVVASLAKQSLDASLGVVAAPTSGAVSCLIEKVGSFFVMNFKLTAARIAVTDGAASGSYGALKLFDFIEGGISFLGCRQDYTAFAEGSALTTAAGDAAFKIGVGTTAIAAAADASLAAGNVNVGGEINITNSGGTGTGSKFTAAGSAYDGTSTAADLTLNFSGSAATIDASSYIDVTGTISVVGVMLGDD